MNKMTITLLVNAIEIENADYAIKRQINIAMKIALPCLVFLMLLPKAKQSEAGINKIEIISIKFVNGVGFSNGWAAFVP